MLGYEGDYETIGNFVVVSPTFHVRLGGELFSRHNAA